MRISDWSSDVCSSDLARSAPLDTAASSERSCRRAAPDGRHYRAGEGLWPLRLSPYPCAARACRLAGQPVGGRAHLAAGGFKGAEETTEAPPALAWRRVVHPVAPAAPRDRKSTRLNSSH